MAAFLLCSQRSVRFQESSSNRVTGDVHQYAELGYALDRKPDIVCGIAPMPLRNRYPTPVGNDRPNLSGTARVLSEVNLGLHMSANGSSAPFHRTMHGPQRTIRAIPASPMPPECHVVSRRDAAKHVFA